MSNIKKTHTPVLLEKTIELLNIKENGTYIDGTLGEGGHSIEILQKLNENGKLISIDQDPESIKFIKKKYKELLKKENWIIVKSNFSKIDQIIEEKTEGDKIDGILLDLGLSSRQIEQESRGFTYQDETQNLDMRMNPELQVTASDLLNGLHKKELEKLLKTYGEERFNRRITERVMKYRENKKIEKVGELKKIIYKALPKQNLIKQKKKGKDPARRTFQALRVAVNDELNILEITLQKSIKLLKKGGRIIVISFHSLEDKIVKEFMENNEKIIREISYEEATKEEIEKNPRSSSAKLRALEKI